MRSEAPIKRTNKLASQCKRFETLGEIELVANQTKSQALGPRLISRNDTSQVTVHTITDFCDLSRFGCHFPRSKYHPDMDAQRHGRRKHVSEEKRERDVFLLYGAAFRTMPHLEDMTPDSETCWQVLPCSVYFID